MTSGCDAFLACVTSSSIEEVGEFSSFVYSVPIICDFPNFFLKDFFSLPPSREVEFTIDLCPDAMPRSKAPYRMSPAELCELKK